MKVYLDNNSATKIDNQVLETMQPFFTEQYANPASLHGHAKEVRKYLKTAIDKISASIHAKKEDHIIITSSSADSNDRLFMSIYLQKILTGQKNHIIISQRESESINDVVKFLGTQGCRISMLPVDNNGIVDTQALKSIITSKTALVSITMLDEQSGAIMPIDEISEICDEYKVPLHSDATHAIGKIPIDVQMLDIDYLTISAEMIHGPTAVGALYVKNTHMLDGLEKNQNNSVGIIGMGKALEQAVDAQAFEMEDTKELRDELEEFIRDIDDNIIIVPWANRAPHCIMAGFKNVDSQMLLWELDKFGISAYMEKERELVDALGIDKAYKHTLIGFSLSRFTTKEEIEHTKKYLLKSIQRVRQEITCTEEGAI